MIGNPIELAQRWPAFAVAVKRVGFASVFAIPLRLRSETIGALNLFNSAEVALTEFDARLAQALADVATIGIIQQRTISLGSILTEQLEHALNSRITLEQAKGVISEFGGVDVGHAFLAIRSHARSRGMKISVLSERLVSRSLDPGVVISAGSRRRRPPER